MDTLLGKVTRRPGSVSSTESGPPTWAKSTSGCSRRSPSSSHTSHTKSTFEEVESLDLNCQISFDGVKKHRRVLSSERNNGSTSSGSSNTQSSKDFTFSHSSHIYPGVRMQSHDLIVADDMNELPISRKLHSPVLSDSRLSKGNFLKLLDYKKKHEAPSTSSSQTSSLSLLHSASGSSESFYPSDVDLMGLSRPKIGGPEMNHKLSNTFSSTESSSISFSAMSTSDPLGLYQTSPAAEQVLSDLGFGVSDSFIPERFMRDWMEKVLKTRLYMQQQGCDQKMDAMVQSTPARHAKTPKQRGIMDFLHKLDTNSRNSAWSRRAKLRRAATVSSYNQVSSHKLHKSKPVIRSGQLEKQDSIDQLRQILEKQVSLLNPSTELSACRRRQFQSCRQNSLPIFLDTLSEVDEANAEKLGTKKCKSVSSLVEDSDISGTDSTYDDKLSRNVQSSTHSADESVSSTKPDHNRLDVMMLHHYSISTSNSNEGSEADSDGDSLEGHGNMKRKTSLPRPNALLGITISPRRSPCVPVPSIVVSGKDVNLESLSNSEVSSIMGQQIEGSTEQLHAIGEETMTTQRDDSNPDHSCGGMLVHVELENNSVFSGTPMSNDESQLLIASIPSPPSSPSIEMFNSRAVLEPAMISVTVVQDDDGSPLVNDVDHLLEAGYGHHLTVIRPAGLSDTLSPVTVIEVELDNQNDSIDSDPTAATGHSVSTGSEDHSSNVSNDSMSDVHGDQLLMIMPNYEHSDQCESRQLIPTAEMGVNASDGCLSPLELLLPYTNYNDLTYSTDSFYLAMDQGTQWLKEDSGAMDSSSTTTNHSQETQTECHEMKDAETQSTVRFDWIRSTSEPEPMVYYLSEHCQTDAPLAEQITVPAATPRQLNIKFQPYMELDFLCHKCRCKAYSLSEQSTPCSEIPLGDILYNSAPVPHHLDEVGKSDFEVLSDCDEQVVYPGRASLLSTIERLTKKTYHTHERALNSMQGWDSWNTCSDKEGHDSFLSPSSYDTTRHSQVRSRLLSKESTSARSRTTESGSSSELSTLVHTRDTSIFISSSQSTLENSPHDSDNNIVEVIHAGVDTDEEKHDRISLSREDSKKDIHSDDKHISEISNQCVDPASTNTHDENTSYNENGTSSDFVEAVDTETSSWLQQNESQPQLRRQNHVKYDRGLQHGFYSLPTTPSTSDRAIRNNKRLCLRRQMSFDLDPMYCPRNTFEDDNNTLEKIIEPTDKVGIYEEHAIENDSINESLGDINSGKLNNIIYQDHTKTDSQIKLLDEDELNVSTKYKITFGKDHSSNFKINSWTNSGNDARKPKEGGDSISDCQNQSVTGSGYSIGTEYQGCDIVDDIEQDDQLLVQNHCAFNLFNIDTTGMSKASQLAVNRLLKDIEAMETSDQ